MVHCLLLRRVSRTALALTSWPELMAMETDLRGLWGGESFTTLASVEEEPVLPRGWWRASATKRRQRGEFKVCLYLAVAQHGNGGTAGLSEEVEVSLLCCSFLSQSYRQLGRFEAGKGVKLPVR